MQFFNGLKKKKANYSVHWQKLSFAPYAFAQWLMLTPSDKVYTCMPLYHATAGILALYVVIWSRSTFCLGHKFSKTTYIDECRRHEATVMQYVGEMARYLLSAPPKPTDRQHNLRMAYGNGMRPDVWEKFRERFGIPVIAELYAATEGMSSRLNYNDGEIGAGAIGRSGPLLSTVLGQTTSIVKIDPETNELIRDKDGFCIKCKNNEKGELLCLIDEASGANFLGYYKNKKASDEKVATDVFKKGDKHFRSGDILYVDDDHRTYFDDRIGDTFRWKGENVSTMEVANVVAMVPGVMQANVYGIKLPNHDGRAGCAKINLSQGATLDLAAMDEVVARELPKYAIPLFLRVSNQDLEVTGNMKLRKVESRDEGADPRKGPEDEYYWYRDGHYSKFTVDDYKKIEDGLIRF